jgi:hypothetical protein
MHRVACTGEPDIEQTAAFPKLGFGLAPPGHRLRDNAGTLPCPSRPPARGGLAALVHLMPCIGFGALGGRLHLLRYQWVTEMDEEFRCISRL